MANKEATEMKVAIHEDMGHLTFDRIITYLSRRRDRRTLHVTWFRQSGILSFSIIAPDGTVEPGGEMEVPSHEEVISWRLAQLADFLKESSSITPRTNRAKKSQLISIAGQGKSLFDMVIPERTKSCIETWPEGAWVTVSTNEAWIPWELLHDGKNFLSDKFLLLRYPRIPIEGASGDTKSSDSEFKHLQCSTLNDQRKLVHVIGGGLEPYIVEKSDRHFMAVREDIQIVRLERDFLADVAQEMVDADLIHFTCHGHANPLRLQVADRDGQVFNLTLTALKNIDVNYGCIVFANACSSAIVEFFQADFYSFGWEFFRKGASVFIGTLGTVPAEAALSFAQSFYDFLFKRGDVCLAFKHARDENVNSFARLLYCFVANPVSLPKIEFAHKEN